jgi:putative ABC transport system permease protein
VSGRLLHDEPGLLLGGSVRIAIAGRTSTWIVVGVVNAGPASAAYAARDALGGVTGDSGVNVVAMASSAAGPGAHADVVSRLRDRLEAASIGVGSSLVMDAARSALEDHMLMVANFLVLMSQLTIVVGGLGLASTMSLSVMERRREIGVMRAIGARHGVIRRLVQGEALVVSLLGWLFAIPLSMPMSVATANAFGRVMLPVTAEWWPSPGAIGAWFVLTVVVSLVASAVPARRATRVSTAMALAYE